MLYTRKGDNGTTKLFDCKEGERVSKDAKNVEALGALDELNSYLGLVKVSVEGFAIKKDLQVSDVVEKIQETLFIVQAELAGSPMFVDEHKTANLEWLIKLIEEELEPIKGFSIPGGTKLSALFDISRTLARKSERRIIAVREEGKRVISPQTLMYMNRLSSILFACARLANTRSNVKEHSPSYT